MKTYKTILHLWITFISLLSFLVGWVMLAHSRKPVQPSQNQNNVVNLAPLPTLAPIQGFGNSGSSGNGLGLFSPQVQQVQPRTRSFLRTGGS